MIFCSYDQLFIPTYASCTMRYIILPVAVSSKYIHIIQTLYCFVCRVIDGWEAIDEMEKQPVKEKNFRPLNEFKIRDITIHANPIAEGIV